jgi:hypothetical protein
LLLPPSFVLGLLLPPYFRDYYYPPILGIIPPPPPSSIFWSTMVRSGSFWSLFFVLPNVVYSCKSLSINVCTFFSIVMLLSGRPVCDDRLVGVDKKSVGEICIWWCMVCAKMRMTQQTLCTFFGIPFMRQRPTRSCGFFSQHNVRGYCKILETNFKLEFWPCLIMYDLRTSNMF